jgi:predicted protein tyrosine phosphatase
MRVRILSRTEVETGYADGADALISIRGLADGNEPQLALAIAQAIKGESARLLKLSFDDIGMAEYGHFVGPTMDQVIDVIEFGRQIADGRYLFDGPSSDPLIVIHCEHGKSRSAAVALALLADHLGDGFELDSVNCLLRADVENRIHPNPLIVNLTDSCLFRYGRLEEALATLSPRFVQWRQLWRDISANPDAYWEKAKRVLIKRSGA